MDAFNAEERTSQVLNHDIPTAARDNRRSYEKRLAVHLILASILFENTAFYTIDLNFPYGLNSNETLNWTTQHSAVATYILNGTIAISMLVFGIICDAKLRRAVMITIGFPFYLSGFILHVLLVKAPSFICPPNDNNYGNATSIGNERCVYWVLPAIIILQVHLSITSQKYFCFISAIGIGSVKANLIAFGADQMQESRATSRYIDKFVVAFSIADIIETSMLIIIPDSPNVIFQLYRVAAAMLVFAALLFFIGWRFYRHDEPYDSVIVNCIPVVRNAFQTWYQYKKSERRIEQNHTNAPELNVPATPHILSNEELEESSRTDEYTLSFLDYAKLINHGKFQDRIVDDVKLLRNALIIPVLLTPFWFSLYQFAWSFRVQASHMAHYNDTENIPNELVLFEPIIAIIIIVILNMFGYKYLQARNRSLTIATKFLISMCFALISIFIAGGVEVWRQDRCHENQTISDLSVYVQFPQRICTSIAQLFALLGSFEFACYAAPRSARSLFVGLYYFSRSVASYSAYTTDIVLSKEHVPMDFICPATEKYTWRYFSFFFILAGVQLIFIIIFIVCQKQLRMTRLNQQQMERSQPLQYSSTRSVD